MIQAILPYATLPPVHQCKGVVVSCLLCRAFLPVISFVCISFSLVRASSDQYKNASSSPLYSWTSRLSWNYLECSVKLIYLMLYPCFFALSFFWKQIKELKSTLNTKVNEPQWIPWWLMKTKCSPRCVVDRFLSEHCQCVFHPGSITFSEK